MSALHADRVVLTTPDEQPLLTLLASQQRLLVSREDTNNEFALLEGNGERGHTTPRHAHRRATETFMVLSGELLFEIDGTLHEAGTGHVAVLPRDTVHSFLVISANARYLTMHTPGGFDAFVRDVSDASQSGEIVDRAAFAALAALHGIEILGPGMRLNEQVSA